MKISSSVSCGETEKVKSPITAALIRHKRRIPFYQTICDFNKANPSFLAEPLDAIERLTLSLLYVGADFLRFLPWKQSVCEASSSALSQAPRNLRAAWQTMATSRESSMSAAAFSSAMIVSFGFLQ